MSGLELLVAAQAAAQIAGSAVRGASALQEGKATAAATMQAADVEARRLRRMASEEYATGQRTAEDKRLEAERAMSRQKALAASSGAGVATGTILDLIGKTAARGKYLADTERYRAQSRASGYRDTAAARLMDAQNAAAAAKRRGQAAFLGSILEGLGTAAGAAHRIGTSRAAASGTGSRTGQP